MFLGKIEIKDGKEVKNYVADVETVGDAVNATVSDIMNFDKEINITISMMNEMINDFNENSEVVYSKNIKYVITED